MDIIRNNQKKNIEIKNTLTDIKNSFNRPINRHNTAEERIREFEDIST